MKTRKKLIEVALPLDDINKASAREKSIRHGHPSTLHLWWARRPLAAARAVIFAQMVDDPSTYVDVLLADSKLRRKAESVLKARRMVWEEAKAVAAKATAADMAAPAPGPEPQLAEVAADIERERLFDIIRELVKWESTTNETVLQRARDEIWQSWRRACADNADHPRANELFDRHKLPAFHDPFAGGGALPLEAQRLGLEAHASDLNPVAVLINKAMIEIPPRFAGRPPVNPEARKDNSFIAREWKGAQGLAEDVRYYGRWMRDEAEKRIGHVYPKLDVTAAMAKERPDLKPYVGRKLTVIAWLWARTVKSPNPAFANVDVPLASTFMLSTKKGKEAYVEPVIEDGDYRFTVKVGNPKDAAVAKAGTKMSRGSNFRCLMSGSPIVGEYIMAEAQAGRMGVRLMAIVAEGDRKRVYVEPVKEHEVAANKAEPEWRPDVDFFQKALGFRVGNYGMTKWSDLFTDRQLTALTTLSDLIADVVTRVNRDTSRRKDIEYASAGAFDLDSGSYAAAVGMYLAFAVSRVSDKSSSLAWWMAVAEKMAPTFSRPTLSMIWDFAEMNPFCTVTSNFEASCGWVAKAVETLPASNVPGSATRSDAQMLETLSVRLISTDPPYYDNIGYADLSDFFYMWLRRSLQPIVGRVFSTVATPKAEELVATPGRHGGTDRAETFFLSGMTQAMRRLAAIGHPAFPVTI